MGQARFESDAAHLEPVVVLLSAGLGFALGWLLAYFQTKRKPAA